MARVIVLPNADNLFDGLAPEVLDEARLIERLDPIHLEGEASSFQFLERLEWAVNGKPVNGCVNVRPYHDVPVG